MPGRRAVVALLLGGVLSGCLGSVPLRPRAYEAAVRVESVAVDFRPDGSGVLDLALEVANPSSDAASVSAVDFELRGGRAARGGGLAAGERGAGPGRAAAAAGLLPAGQR
ncbi:hypothetical protein ACLESD_46625, partial [Pyxidicoccus sp. 3LFB2]